MFAGRRRRSSNVRIMQLFHELKQQFPTVPDHIVTSCIASFGQSNSPTSNSTIQKILEAAAAQEQMGRSPPQQSPTLAPHSNPFEQFPTPQNFLEQANLSVSERERFEMNESVSAINENVVQPCVSYSKKFETVTVSEAAKQEGNSTFYVKRPNCLDIKPDTFSFPIKLEEEEESSNRLNNIQLSGKCRDVHKLLNNACPLLFSKPPKSPLSAKRSTPTKTSPTKSPLDQSSYTPPLNTQKRLPPLTPNPPEPSVRKKETVSTPTQTTDTLLGGTNSVNLSLNVNCSMDVVQSPTKHKAVIQVTPQQPWLQEPVSPRSYNSVNFVIRPPSSEPQAPIDITSQNSSLTYSTSSFDSKKGLQSRLQITVGPGGSSSVSASRARPRSCYLIPESDVMQEVVPVPVRAGSLNDLAVNLEPPVIIRQQARIERLRIEITNEKTKLLAVKKDVEKLEVETLEKEKQQKRIDCEMEKQILMEISHLKYQCKQLSTQQKGDFYGSLYTGQRGPLFTDIPPQRTRERLNYHRPQLPPLYTETEGDKWNCHMCTFLNHPDLNKCEECEMPRIHHGNAPSSDGNNNVNSGATNLRNCSVMLSNAFGSLSSIRSSF